MIIRYVMICAGALSHPIIHHAILNNYTPEEDRQLQRIVKTLAAQGYFSFTVYDVSGEHHVQIGRYTVETVDPIINFI